jgi:hypothetical protein
MHIDSTMLRHKGNFYPFPLPMLHMITICVCSVVSVRGTNWHIFAPSCKVARLSFLVWSDKVRECRFLCVSFVQTWRNAQTDASGLSSSWSYFCLNASHMVRKVTKISNFCLNASHMVRKVTKINIIYIYIYFFFWGWCMKCGRALQRYVPRVICLHCILITEKHHMHWNVELILEAVAIGSGVSSRVIKTRHSIIAKGCQLLQTSIYFTGCNIEIIHRPYLTPHFNQQIQ